MELTFSREEWPHGLRCMECDERLQEGYVYSKRLVGIDDDHPITEIVCAPCGLGLPRLSEVLRP